MKIDEYFKIARSYFSNETKKIFALYFNENSNDLFKILNSNFSNKMISQDKINFEIDNLYKKKYEILTINNDLYPKLLKNIIDAPILLSIKGNKQLLNDKNIAIVGSRQIEKQDISLIKKTVGTLNEINCHIVSGLAYGTDFIAHENNLSNGTIAVMPCGINNCYPQEHIDLYKKIIDFGGIIISDFEYNEPPKQYNFIKRNKIIAGISNSLIIIRARTIKSGTMSSAKFAKNLNRNIYTFNLTGEKSGNDYLLVNNYAKLVKDFVNLKNDVLNDIKNNNFIKMDIDNNQLNLFSSKNEKKYNIKDIIKISKIKPIEKNFYKLFNLCNRYTDFNEQDIIIELLNLIT